MKKIVCTLLVLLISLNFITPLAQGLHTTYFEKSIPITKNLKYTSYVGEDSSSNLQNVHMLDFNPSGDTLPIVSYGKSLLSHKTVKSMMQTEAKKSGNVVAGINGDFYSFQTGIPMSTVIRDGVLLSTDSGNNAIGFRKDGTVIVGKPQIKMVISFEAKTADNTTQTFKFDTHYNKYPTVYSVYMMDTNYSTKTASTFPCREIVIKASQGLRMNSQTVFEVVENRENVSNTEIPAGSMVLSIPNVLANSDKFSYLKKGDKVTLNVTANKEWENIYTAIGGGDVIVENGAFVPEVVDEYHEKYNNARSAVGVRKDGTVFFVAVDGDGKSGAGMNFKNLAEFMIGEGAVTALNLDGGGSTTVAVSFPSESEIEVLNTPKDGSLRGVSNSILLLNKSQALNVPVFADLSTSDAFFLGGASYSLVPVFYDGQGNEVLSIPMSANYTSSVADATFKNGKYISADKSYIDHLHANFSFGDTTVKGEAVINVTDKIDTLALNKNSVVLKKGQTFKLSVVADRLGIPVVVPLEALTYTDLSQNKFTSSKKYIFENDYITISKDGTVTAKDAPLFTRVDISVSYKNTKSILSFYFGKHDDIIEDFDTAEWRSKIANANQKVLSDGYRSGYSITANDGNVVYSTPLSLDIVPKQFTIWLKGKYLNDLVAVVQIGGKQELIPYYIIKNYSDINGWIQLVALMPAGVEGDVKLLSMISSKSSKPFTVDRFMIHYGYSDSPFEDVEGIWSQDYIVQLFELGIINGYRENGNLIFKPDNNITRAEFAKMLSCYLSLNTKAYTGYGTAFADAEKIADWAAGYIKAISSEGYMNGKSNPNGTITFDSNSYITREEAMHVFAKLLKTGNSNYALNFSDSDKIQPWALESVKRVVSAGIVTGFDDGTLRASDPITRAQMCAMFIRLFNIK